MRRASRWTKRRTRRRPPLLRHARLSSERRSPHQGYSHTYASRLRSQLRKNRVPVKLPWLAASLLGGAGGTAALSLAYETDRRLRRRSQPQDYDDSLIPGQIVVSIMRLAHVTEREERDLGLGLRWSYGSAFGLWHGVLRRARNEPQATTLFGATLMTLTLTMFPLLGHTPPPWRWPRGYLATSVVTHTIYAVAVGVIADRASDRRRMRP